MDAIFSLKPYWADAILGKTKTIELRALAPRNPIERVWIYSTAPVQKIVGYFRPGKIFDPMQWRPLVAQFGVQNLTGLSEATDEQLRGFFGEGLWHAITIHEPTPIPPIDPRQDLGLEYLWTAPQSWRYLGTKEQNALRNRAP